MRLLLDTHVWLWLQYAPERLGNALALAEDPAADLILSAVSTWEIAVKWELGRLPLPEPPARYVPDRIASSGVRTLGIEVSHTLAVATLPRHHRDPFDRLLIAQAMTERATLVTADGAMAAYDVDLVRII
ncbi:type II toxin-antitoxin system VapC family toxin [soil metagenome]